MSLIVSWFVKMHQNTAHFSISLIIHQLISYSYHYDNIRYAKSRAPSPRRRFPIRSTLLSCLYKSDVNYDETANLPLSTVSLTLKTASRQKSEPSCDLLKFPLVSEYQMRFSIAITVLLLSVICRATFSTRFLTPPNEI